MYASTLALNRMECTGEISGRKIIIPIIKYCNTNPGRRGRGPIRFVVIYFPTTLSRKQKRGGREEESRTSHLGGEFPHPSCPVSFHKLVY